MKVAFIFLPILIGGHSFNYLTLARREKSTGKLAILNFPIRLRKTFQTFEADIRRYSTN